MESKNTKEQSNNDNNTNTNTNKNKFQALFIGGNKKKISSDLKETPEKNDIPSQNNKASYLNTLLKKSFFDTINKTANTSLNISVTTQKNSEMGGGDDNSGPKIPYPTKRPKNFVPSYLFENININKNKKITRQTRNELRDVLDLYEKQKSNMFKTERDLGDAKEDLKKAKEARKKIMEEVYQIKKDIENFNNNGNINDNNSYNNINNRSRLSLQAGNLNVDLFKSLNKSEIDNSIHEDNEKRKTELDNEIREYEDKISQLKFKNKSFMEDYDILINDYKKNLAKNLKLQNCNLDIDKKIKEEIKEKVDLKKYIDKMGKV